MHTTLFVYWLSLSLGLFVPARHSSDADRPVEAVRQALGATPVPHTSKAGLAGVSVEKGRQLVLEGRTAGSPGRVSKHFVCTSCHNVERDEPALDFVRPEERLAYVRRQGLPYLPGSALYGIVNRTSFYNGDYESKYGELVKPARNDLRQAIQLCATECAQGRLLEDWELESVLAYLWTLELTLGDLALSPAEQSRLDGALAGKEDARAALEMLDSKYARAAPATFAKPPADRQAGYAHAAPDLQQGRFLYESACLHCHQNERYAFFNLDNSIFSFRQLEKNIGKYTKWSLYQVICYGTSPIPGKRAYMPNFTEQKMSRQQVEDLRAYIEWRAEGHQADELATGRR